jgi:hypothetical protein
LTSSEHPGKQSKFAFLYHQSFKHRWDILLAISLAIVAGLAAYLGAQSSTIIQSNNLWFDADNGGVFQSMVWHEGNHTRSSVHPLFALVTLPPVYFLRKVLDFEPFLAVKLMICLAASLWLSNLFILLRLVGCRRLDALLFSLVGAISASAFFWFTVPETYSFGSVSILLALCFVALTQRYKFSWPWYVGVSALTLSFTVTNWMAGIAATAINHRWKRSLQITAGAFFLVGLFTFIQKFAFKTAVILGSIDQTEETKFILGPESGGLLRVIASFLFHTMVMPAIQIIRRPKDAPNDLLMSVQHSLPGSANLWGVVAVSAWIALLGLGLWALFSSKENQKLRVVLGLILVGQLVLHCLYGNQTFLYSLHFAPLLVLLTALTTLTRFRSPALILAGILLLSAGINNSLQLKEAGRILNLYNGATPGTQRVETRLQMHQRPHDVWTRGKGHVVLAAPGSLEVDKSYYEPGGSFSPRVGSFGVSIWSVYPTGKATQTSDTIPLSQIQQQLVWKPGENLPGILAKTDSYQALWSSPAANRWQLALSNPPGTNTKPVLVIRSVGPAGSPIQSLRWDRQTLHISDLWSLTVTPTPTQVYLGDERSPNWMTEKTAITQWKGDDGWGYARLELGDGKNWTVEIKDLASKPKPALSTAATKSALELNLPDWQFIESLNAQVAHIAMGVVGKQPRPGDPTNYPLPWLRDGAYEVVALARAGQLDLAKQLATDFAEKDFFGGFGPEADAPGLSIWALESIAAQLKSPEYDRWLWPHVRRKAEFILEMLAATQPIHRPVTAPIVPRMQDDPELTLVAEPARNGLIVGRMDGHRPLLFVNAVSYRGLLDAASLADRLNQSANAQRWRTKAEKLKQAWQKALKPPESENDRTYISGLWPTWIAADYRDEFLQGLQRQWTTLRDSQGAFKKTPDWTYFNIAEAHQWLFLGRSDLTWKTLRWFWNHQVSPGLYTWWEGKGEENSSGDWEKVRGWVYPPHVTPHYWTAAEMLLLQLDMLAYVHESTRNPTAVIGAGIPATWLNQPLTVKGLPILGSEISWSWDKKAVHVQIRGGKMAVQLGSVFPSQTLLQVEYVS